MIKVYFWEKEKVLNAKQTQKYIINYFKSFHSNCNNKSCKNATYEDMELFFMEMHTEYEINNIENDDIMYINNAFNFLLEVKK